MQSNIFGNNGINCITGQLELISAILGLTSPMYFVFVFYDLPLELGISVFYGSEKLVIVEVKNRIYEISCRAINTRFK